MGRPRTSNVGLPSNVYLRHNAYYMVRDKRWFRLTDRLIEVPAAVERLVAKSPISREEMAAFLKGQLAKSRAGAKVRRNLEHALTADDIDAMLAECQWRCAVTSVPFSMKPVGARSQRPYAPSIDRIDSSLGYVRANCRIVCVAANIAMNSWGHEVLLTLLRHARDSKVLDKL